jgi:AcrR family transcriptional regulator
MIEISITENTVKEMIELLELEENMTVTELSKRLNVSRGMLYRDFSHVLPKKGKQDTKQTILDSIRLLQARFGSKKLSISQVVKESGISRSSISRNYTDLHCYIYGKKELPKLENLPNEVLLEQEISTLKSEIKAYDENKYTEIKEIENNTYSSLMKLDLAHYRSESTTTSLHNIQVQADEYRRKNQELANNNASLRSRIVGLEEKTTLRVQAVLLDHLKPNYFLLIEAIKNGAEKTAINKLFREQENEYLQRSITRVNDLSPDTVIFFQPFFNCKYSSVPLSVSLGKVVIVESNIVSSEIRREFCELINCQKIAIYSIDSLNRTKYFCRTNTLDFSDIFIKHYHTHLNYPEIDEGFNSVLSFKPIK